MGDYFDTEAAKSKSGGGGKPSGSGMSTGSAYGVSDSWAPSVAAPGSNKCPPGWRWNPSSQSCEPESEWVIKDKARKDKLDIGAHAISSGEEALKEAEKLPGTYQPYLDFLDQEKQSVPGRAAAAGAQALAPIYGQSGMGGFLATPAAGLTANQVAQDAERAGEAQLRGIWEDLTNGRITQQEATIAAKNLAIQLDEMKMEQTDLARDLTLDTELEAELGGVLEEIRGGNKGWGFLDDDEQAMWSQMKTYMDNKGIPEDNPQYVARMRQVCSWIDSGDAGADWCRAKGYAIDTVDI